jgi:hypothetical protein
MCGLVLEVAFEGLQRLTEADELSTLEKLPPPGDG